MDAEKLKEILDLHEKWLNDEVSGVRADLESANLKFALTFWRKWKSVIMATTKLHKDLLA